MDINIKTKYKSGDTVWITCLNNNDQEHFPMAVKIIKIDLQIWSNVTSEVQYFVDGVNLYYKENNLFANAEDAQEECYKLNHRL